MANSSGTPEGARGLEAREIRGLVEQLRLLSGVPSASPAPPPSGRTPSTPGSFPFPVPHAHAASGGTGSQPNLKFRNLLARVVEFKSAEGRLPGCGRAPRDERNLGAWLYRQRRRWAAGEMTANEAEALDAALGPWWTLPPRKARKAESEALRGHRKAPGEPPRRSMSA
ncbi:helicase associated domain-containing protein [Sinomonas gamaensis]|uniref:helicase associated domain-containing protein n=1 Tax=Sinomonas gamaensis TaxID=2565624 RepID=UPI00110840DB|nr:helicase associated domain-containing protein [Sinomonas gamaensis]